MAKNKVINTVLTVRDNMSGGLVKAAQNAKKSGKAIDSSMISATRSVVAFKNKSVKALTDTAKKGFNGLVSIAKTSALAITASITGIAVGFAALDGATEEYRIAQGKLNAGFWVTRTPRPKPLSCLPTWQRMRKRLQSGRGLPQACMARLAIRCQSRD